MKKYIFKIIIIFTYLFSINSHAGTGKEFHGFPLLNRNIEFGILNANVLSDKDKVCIVGNYLNDDDARVYGRIMLLSISQNKVLWQKKIAAPDRNINNNIIGCVGQGDFIYAVSNVDTDSHQATNTTLVYVYKFDLHGTQLASKKINISHGNGLAYGILNEGNELHISGLVKNSDDVNEYYSMFTVKFNESLNLNIKYIKNGGFSNDSSIKILGEDLFIGGEFYPKNISKNKAFKDYANSRIRLSNGYIWSVRPQSAPSLSVKTAISSLGNIYSMNIKKSTTLFSIVDPNGKILKKFEYPSKFCRINSMMEFQENILAIRKPCNDAFGKSAIVSVNIEKMKEKEITELKGEPVFIFSDSLRWYAISKNSSGDLIFEFGNSVGVF